MLLLPLLALAAAWSHGQAQVLLKQTQASVTVGQTRTAWMECVAEGISNFQSKYIHWYRHIPSKAPQRILYIGSGQVYYDDDSYRNKYTSFKSTKVCTFSVNDVNSNDEGTYYCAYW
ncbi:LV321 protein, partial [Ibidorhyncha struthersii]|nr:LV321 protein [Ibidorhyncha struthersii]